MALDSTVGSATANSYATLADLESYLEIHPFDSAVTFTDDEAMLQYSTLLLESLVIWKGFSQTETQALHFPISTNEDVIPADVKYAQMELMLHLNTSTQLTSANNDFKTIEFGEVRIDMNNDATAQGTTEMLPPLVQSMLSNYGSVKTSGVNTMNSVNVIRG